MITRVVKTARLDIPTEDLRKLDELLAKLTAIEYSKALLAGMRKAGNVVKTRARETAPARQTKRPKTKQIIKTHDGKEIEMESIRKAGAYRVVAFVQDNAPMLEVRVKAARRAPHLHLIELGHDIVVRGTKNYGRSDQSEGLEWDAKLGRIRKRAHRGSRRSRLAAESRRTGERGKGAVVGRVPANPFLMPAGQSTAGMQTVEIVKAAKEAISNMIAGRAF